MVEIFCKTYYYISDISRRITIYLISFLIIIAYFYFMYFMIFI